MGCVPGVSDDVVSCAVQVLLGAGLQATGLPTLTALSLNCTVPSGVTAPSVGVTVAVKVTGNPWSAGLSDEMSAVVVLNRSPVVVAVLVVTSPKFDPETVAKLLYWATGFGPFTVTSKTTLIVLPTGSKGVTSTSTGGGGGGGGLASRVAMK